MNPTKYAITRTRVTFVFLLVIIIGGVYSYIHLPRSYDPGFILRVSRIVTYFPGASPERVENLVTDKIEKVIMEIPELDYVSSRSMPGVSIIDVWIKESYTNMRPIWDKLRRKVDKAKRELPETAMAPIVNDDFGEDVFGIVIAVTGDDYSYKALKEAADDLKDELLSLNNVGKIELYGDQEERVFVSYSNAKLSQLGITPYSLMKILESRNIIIPGGAVDIGNERIALEPTGNFTSIKDLEKTIISIPGREDTVFLKDIVDIKRGYIDPPRNLMRGNGKRCVGLAISLKKDGNLITLGNSVKKRLKELTPLFPYGINFEVVNFSPKEVQDKVLTFQENLIQSVVIVLLATLFMLGLRTGFIVASLIPMVILMTFLIMYFLDIGIDQMSLASLVIALGMLVDNAIVMTESIQVEMGLGKSSFKAAVDSAMELAVPLLTSSATTAASFLPIYLAESTTGEYTAPLFKVVSLALLCSWVLSLTMIPLFCVWFIKSSENSKISMIDRLMINLRGIYKRLLFISLQHKYISIGIVCVVFILSMGIFKKLPVIFFPPSDRLMFTMEMKLSPGTTIETTEALVKKVEAYINKDLLVKKDGDRGVRSFVTHIGSTGPRIIVNLKTTQGMPHYAFMVINVTDIPSITEISRELKTYILSTFPDVDLKIKRIQNGPPVSDPVQIRVSGKSSKKIFAIADKIKKKLASFDGTLNITDDWGRRTKKFVVRVDHLKARRAGVSSRDIALSLNTALNGFKLTEFREDDKLIPVLLKNSEINENTVDRLESLAVYSSVNGTNVPLSQVADIIVEWQPSEIIRRDRKKTVTVSCQLEKGYTAMEIIKKIDPWLKKEQKSWSIGYKYAFGGETEKSIQANNAIMEKLPICGFIILMILIFQFNSIRRTAIILTTIPLALIGVGMGLYIMDLYFGFMTLLGIVSLAGIVVNNAIVLIDRIKVEIRSGREPAVAVIYASERRLRPILLTTVTTMVGVLPLYFGGGEIWAAMVVSIFFGLGFSTLLTLGVVPILYSIFFRIKYHGDELKKLKNLRIEE